MNTHQLSKLKSNIKCPSKSSDSHRPDQAAPGTFDIPPDLSVEDYSKLTYLLWDLAERTNSITYDGIRPRWDTQAPAVQHLVKHLAGLSGVDLGNREQVLDELQAALETMQHRLPVASQPSICTAGLVEKFLESRRADLADDSFLTHSGILRSFARFFPKLPMDPEVIEHYIAERRGQGKGSLSPGYRRLLHSSLTGLYAFAHKRYGVADLMSQIDRPRKGKSRESDYLTLDLLKLLLAAIEDDRTRGYVYLCVGQGLRPEEPLRLNIDDILADRIRVWGKERMEFLPLLPEVREALGRISAGRAGTDAVFVGYSTGKRLGRKQIYNVVRALFREAGISGIMAAPKVLRHTFNSLAQSAGCDRASAEALMRQHTPNVNDFYLHISVEERLRLLRAKLEQYSPLRQANGDLPLNLIKSTG